MEKSGNFSVRKNGNHDIVMSSSSIDIWFELSIITFLCDPKPMNYPVLQSRVSGSKSEQNFEDVLNSTPSNADAASAPTTPSLEEKVPL